MYIEYFSSLESYNSSSNKDIKLSFFVGNVLCSTCVFVLEFGCPDLNLVFACMCVFRFKDIDPETGIETTQKSSDSWKDVYPVHIVQENKDGIQGSCAFFKVRTDVTKQVRSKSLTPLLNLQEALERFVEFV